MERKTKEQIMQEMDSAAKQAEVELEKLDQTSVKVVAEWIKKWYLKAGYKRLGRLLVKRV